MVNPLIVPTKAMFINDACQVSLDKAMDLNKFTSDRAKMCLKSPGTPLKASSAHICPRTFETHFK